VFAEAFAPYADHCIPARIALEHQHIYRVYTEEGETLARVRGRLRHQAERREAFPAVGDWVALTPGAAGEEAAIEALLPRTSRFSRKVAGELTEEQVVAANIDTVFLVSGLDQDFNLRRIERYLTTAWDGGARPVILLNKADLAADVAAIVAEVDAIACGAPVHAVSSRDRIGLDALPRYLGVGQTCAFLGSSGVGKSTLINALLGVERQRTREVRESDSRGRHTTTSRELLVLPRGGLLVDTPGMREMQLWDGNLADAFADIETLGEHCHFRDCRHEEEPRCAVRAAVAEGRLDADRLDSFRKLQRELALQVRRQDQLAQIVEKRKLRVMHKSLRRLKPKG
jgi:ribosome biogenesis GTPase